MPNEKPLGLPSGTKPTRLLLALMAHVLIVEDEILVLMLAESVLEQAGHVTLTAHTVAEARIIIHSGQRVDLVFTDLKLGEDADGGSTVGELVEQHRCGTPVLYTSGHTRTRGAFLPKPYTAPELAEAVSSLLLAA